MASGHNHFCLTLARQLGLNTALSEVVEFDGAVAIVVDDSIESLMVEKCSGYTPKTVARPLVLHRSINTKTKAARVPSQAMKLPAEVLMQRLREMTAALPDAIADTSRAVERRKLRHPNLVRLRDRLHTRVAEIMKGI